MKHFKYIRTGILLFVYPFIFTAPGAAQNQVKYNWQLGVGIGYTNYYGDVSNYRIHESDDFHQVYRFAGYNKNYVNQPSFSLLLQKKITPTLGFTVQANHMQIAMSDRYKNKNGSIDTNAINYARSLNFKTKIKDVGVAFAFNANNGKLFAENAFFYPSVHFGVGVSTFTVKGDLYDENGNQYNYRLKGNIMDGSFETNLRDLRTEKEEKYRNVEPYADLAIGLNFRFSELFAIALQTDIKYSASDFLDDVSGVYKPAYPTPAEAYAAKPGYNVVNPSTRQRGNNNSINDFYINNRLVLNFRLAKKTQPRPFISPVIYSLSIPATIKKTRADTIVKKNISVQDTLKLSQVDSLVSAKIDSAIVRDNPSATSRQDSVIQKQLSGITSELKEIKNVLREQGVRPRLQQLQYQLDLLINERNKLLNQRTRTREDNLRLQIYGLQADSVRNEMERLQWRGQYQARENDSITSYLREETRDTGNNRRLQNMADVQYTEAGVTDTLSALKLKEYENEIKVIKKSNRYRTDKNLKSGVDSLETRLTKYKALNSADLRTAESAPKDQPLNTPINSNRNAGSADQRRMDSLQQRLQALERQIPNMDTVSVSDSVTVIEINKDDSTFVQDNNEAARNLRQLENLLQQNADSIALLQHQLKRSDDSAAYYKKVFSEAAETGTPDSSRQKKKWYQKLFQSSKNKNKLSVKSADQDEGPRKKNQQEDVKVMQAKIDEIEKRNMTLSEQYETLKRSGDQARAGKGDLAVKNIDSVAFNRRITRLESDLRQNADSVVLLQRELKRTNDLAVYYRRMTFVEAETGEPQTDETKRKWYQKLFGSKKRESQDDKTSTLEKDAGFRQQQSHTDAIYRMQQMVNETERRNRELTREYDRLSAARDQRRNNNNPAPVIVYQPDRDAIRSRNQYSDNNELSALRTDIERLRDDINRNNKVNLQPAESEPENVRQPVPDNSRVVQIDSAEVRTLRTELDQLKNELDSLRNVKPAVIEKPEKMDPVFDTRSFPVISVYFKLGAAVLTADQVSRITSFAHAATSNTQAEIVLKGFTDAVGSPVINRTIAGKRTDHVKNLLISQFKIQENRIEVDEPAVLQMNKMQRPNPLDRRVDISFK